jgi:hypothetical protein
VLTTPIFTVCAAAAEATSAATRHTKMRFMRRLPIP